jgi:MFS transporter, putative metabolite transport protein
MHCESRLKVGMFGTLYFLGFLISSLIFPPMSDRVGRKKMFMLGAFAQVFTFLGMLFFKTLTSHYLLIFSLGVSQPVKTMIAYTHMMEFLPDRESMVSGTFMCLDGLIYFFSPLFFKNLSNNLDVIILLAFLMNLFGIIGFLIIKVPESLKFLITNGQIDRFWEDYTRLEALNGGS